MRLLPLALLVALLLPGHRRCRDRAGRARRGRALDAGRQGRLRHRDNTTSKVWHTLEGGELTEVYYPRPRHAGASATCSSSSPTARRSPSARPTRRSHTITLTDKRSLTYRQVTVARPRFRIVKTYVTDPARNALLVDVRFTSLTGKKLALYALADPALSNDGNDDSGTATAPRAARARRERRRGADRHSRASRAPRVGYLGTSDGWSDLRTDFRMDWAYTSAPNGNVVQTGRTTLDGVRKRHLTLALGFGGNPAAARSTARAALDRGFGRAARRYADGWHRYLGSLKARPRSARADRDHLRRVGDDARRARGQDLPRRLRRLADDAVGVGPGPLEPVRRLPPRVVARPLPDRHRADGGRRHAPAPTARVDYLFDRQQKPDGSFPQNSTVDGTPQWGNLQLDEVAFPIVLAWQLGRRDAAHLRARQAGGRLPARQRPAHARRSAGRTRAATRPRRSPSEIAGLVTARRHRAAPTTTTRAPQRWLKTADDWQSQGRRLDRHDDRPLLVAALLPAPDQGRRPERGHDVQPRRQRPERSTSARSSTRASSSSCASASSPRAPR